VIPFVGDIVEGMLGASRKILTAVNSVPAFQDEARELASRAREMVRVIRNRLDYHTKLRLVGVPEEPVARVLQSLEDIANVMNNLANTEHRHILANRDLISSQIKSYAHVFTDALQAFNASLNLDNKAVLDELCARIQTIQDNHHGELDPVNARIDNLHHTVVLAITVQAVVLFGKAPTCPSR